MASYPYELSRRLVKTAPGRLGDVQYTVFVREIQQLSETERGLLRLSLAESARNPSAQSVTLVAPLIAVIVAFSGWTAGGIARDAMLGWLWAGILLVIAMGMLVAMVGAGASSARRAGRSDHWLAVIDGKTAAAESHGPHRRRR